MIASLGILLFGMVCACIGVVLAAACASGRIAQAERDAAMWRERAQAGRAERWEPSAQRRAAARWN